MRFFGVVLYACALLPAAAGCAGSDGRGGSSGEGGRTEAAPTPQPTAAPAPAATGTAGGPRPRPTLPPQPASPPAPALEGRDFLKEAGLLARAAACAAPGQAADLPAHLDATVVERHCKKVNEARATYERKWLDKAMPYLAEVVPDDLPTRVFYPFGGGDLLTVLAVYPEATEITAVSLEGMGDPREIDTLTGKELVRQLALEADNIEKFLLAAYNRTYNLHDLAVSKLPGLLVLGLVALDIHGYEPVSLRYFRLEQDGSIHYLTDADITAATAAAEQQRKQTHNQLQIGAFTNAEVRYRKKGDPSAPVRIYRHIAENLSNNGLTASPLLAHVKVKGKIPMMTKAAAYLLWRPDFSTIRDFMLDNMLYMVSDDSGIPHKFAKAKGFVQDTYGTYAGAFGTPSQALQEDNIKLWKKNPQRDLPFVFGYPAKGRNHMMVTRRP